MEDGKPSRRTIVKRLAYVAPIVLSLAATPAFARSGSGAGHRIKVKTRKRR